MLHYSPGGAVPKGMCTMYDSFSAVSVSLQLEYCLREVTETLIAKQPDVLAVRTLSIVVICAGIILLFV